MNIQYVVTPMGEWDVMATGNMIQLLFLSRGQSSDKHRRVVKSEELFSVIQIARTIKHPGPLSDRAQASSCPGPQQLKVLENRYNCVLFSFLCFLCSSDSWCQCLWWQTESNKDQQAGPDNEPRGSRNWDWILCLNDHSSCCYICSVETISCSSHTFSSPLSVWIKSADNRKTRSQVSSKSVCC